MIRAILRAQWLSMRIFRLASGRRGAVFSAIVAVLWYGFWTILAVVAEELTAAPQLRTQIENWLPAGMLAVFAYWQLAPLASASLGASLDLRKLLVYPVPRRSLFLVEILLRITTCAELLLLLAGAAIGLLRNPAFGGWSALARVPLAVVLFAAFNLMLAAGLRNLIERLLSRKGIREVIGLLLMLVGVLPRLLIVTKFGGALWSRRIERVFPAAANPFWPWGAAAHSMLGLSSGAWPMAAAATLAGWTVAAYLFGRWQFTRGLRYDFQEAQATVATAKERPFAERLYRLPSLLLPDPLAAMVEKELRSLVRTPRFRMVFVMGFSFGLVVWLPMMLRGRVTHSAVSGNFLAVVSLYALFLLAQVTYGNAFGFDGSAAQLYFAAPVAISRALAAKNIAAAVFIFLEIAAVAAACSLLRLGISSGQIAEAFLVTGIAALYLLGIGNLSSVNYPRPMSARRVSAGGSGGRAQGLLFLLYPIALLPVFLAYVARYAFDNQTVFYGVLAFAAALGVAIYWMAMESAVSSARTRRETILAELSRGEGPMVAD
jgi:ABC-2 type transport system permease protein